jgi:anti-sigma regulatory factor (Ser/Thr protein kinase)
VSHFLAAERSRRHGCGGLPCAAYGAGDGHREGVPDLAAGLAPARTYECPLAPDAGSARTARAAVRRELAAWGAADLIEDCCLIVTELVTNAVRHGGGAIHLRLGMTGRWVYGEVSDEGERLPRVRSGDLDATGGRGLLIVDRVADEWGVARMPHGGKIVWFLLGADGPGPPPNTPVEFPGLAH